MLLDGREKLFRRLRGADVRFVDAPPQQLHVPLVGEYLGLKRSGLV